MDPTKRRVFAGETVPASEKVVNLFEPHTDIICKQGRARDALRTPEVLAKLLRQPEFVIGLPVEADRG